MRNKTNSYRFLMVLLGISVLRSFTFSMPAGIVSKLSESRVELTDLRLDAFEILKTKCNTCHSKQNPRRVFNLSNMEAFAPRIYQQVFIKKRMPKGKGIKLTQGEYETLQKWLLTLTLKN